MGEVTDEGVGASCQPPFAWEEKKKNTENNQWGWKVEDWWCGGGGGHDLMQLGFSPEAQEVCESSVECWDTSRQPGEKWLSWMYRGTNLELEQV